MSLLFETIRLQDGKFMNLDYHTYRLNKSRKELYGIDDSINLESLLQVLKGCDKGIFKCRVLYSKNVEDIQYEHYQPRKTESLRLVEDNSISYSYKFSDRTHLNVLFSKRNSCDDVLIVKNGLITDTCFANIVFTDGRKWITPYTPLLEGTTRAYLLKNRIITEAKICKADLKNFKSARIINAMLPFGSSPDIPVSNVWF